MTIKIRNLKRSPTGRESVRERDYDQDSLTIGRDVKNDLELITLDVALNHARLRLNKDGQAVLDILNGQSAQVDGRMRSGLVSSLIPGSLIRIGSYELRIEPPSDKAALIVTVEQIEQKSINIGASDASTVFGLQRALPGKRFMAWTFAVCILGLFLVLPIMAFKHPENPLVKASPIQADLAWNSGKISLMHSNLKHDCKTCHEAPFETVKDSACMDCHTDLRDHAKSTLMEKSKPAVDQFTARLNQVSEAFGRDIDRCSSCHVEHNSRAHILPDSQAMCADCHKDIEAALPDTKLLNASDFGSNHPQFYPTIIVEPSFTEPVTRRVSLDDNPQEFSGLKFPHDIHLSTKGAVARMANQLDPRFGFENGIGCSDCHVAEAGGALFEPVSMTKDCAMCHSIVFEDDEGFQRTLRHGQPEEVIASMRDFYQAKALGNIRDAEMNSTTRRRPGRAAKLRSLNLRELAFKQADERTAVKVNAIFSEGGACYDCHVIDRPVLTDEDVSNELDFSVRPISVSDSFYPKSPFNHEAHDIGNLSCKDCHIADTSNKSSDVLLPKIEKCRSCHIGEESYKEGGDFAKGTFPTNCLTCHSYHDGPHANIMGHSE